MAGTIEITVDQVGPTTGQAVARSHTLLVDRPHAKGGSDKGPLGGELLLVSLAGCFLSNLLAAVNARTADVSDVQVAVIGTVGGTPERVESMAVRVRARYSDPDLMAKLVSIAERGCLVTNTLRSAVSLSFTFEPR